MLALLRQPLIKSVKITQFGVKKFTQPIPRVHQRSYGRYQQSEPDGIFKKLVGLTLSGAIIYMQYHVIKRLESKSTE
ncbi:hypothetical protein HCN44_006802 [Aphidius gifuensis]|uniref:Uncharacterized protein n=1 Tax=Aphidius gifuensis TaxID=684658 RepID=A0A834Y0T8_APHGI|nr:hypothetical protein HCN44_006802 [Aphidius gifuensis]